MVLSPLRTSCPVFSPAAESVIFLTVPARKYQTYMGGAEGRTFRGRSALSPKPGHPEEPRCRRLHRLPSAARTHPRVVEVCSSQSSVAVTAKTKVLAVPFAIENTSPYSQRHRLPPSNASPPLGQIRECLFLDEFVGQRAAACGGLDLHLGDGDERRPRVAREP